MKNNQGQVLVTFVLLLPILIMFFGLTLDCGYLYIEKRNVDNNVKDALKYGLNNISEDTHIIENQIKKQLNLNIDDIKNINVIISEQTIEIEIDKIQKSIFTMLFSNYNYKISSHYRGYINEKELVLRKV